MVTIRRTSWINCVSIIIPYLFIVGIFQVFAHFLLGLPVGDAELNRTSWEKFIIVFFSAVGTFSTIWLFRVYIDKESIKSLGLDFLDISGKEFRWAIFMPVLIMSLAFFLLLFTKQIQYIQFKFSLNELILNCAIFILVAFTEELFIRGYILNNLMGSINKFSALIISSVIFAIMHLANPNINLTSFSNLILAGILLGLPCIYKRNLWLSIAFHFSWNFFQGSIFGFNVSGLNGYSMITQMRRDDTIWNGGSFGFEGSILCIMLQVFCIVILYFLFEKRLKFRNPVV
ncbi:CAAX amino terminal protease self- immunity [compost metagenome]